VDCGFRAALRTARPLDLGKNDVRVIFPIVSGEVLGIAHVGVGGLSVVGDDGKARAAWLLIEARGEVEASVEAGSKIDRLCLAFFAGDDAEAIFALRACGHKGDIDLVVDGGVVLTDIA